MAGLRHLKGHGDIKLAIFARYDFTCKDLILRQSESEDTSPDSLKSSVYITFSVKIRAAFQGPLHGLFMAPLLYIGMVAG